MQLTSNNLCVGFEVGIIILYIWLGCRFWRLEDDNRVLIFGLFMHYALKCMYNVDSQTCYRVYLHIHVQLPAVYAAYTTLYTHRHISYPTTFTALSHLNMRGRASPTWATSVPCSHFFSFWQKETNKKQNSKCSYLLEKIFWTLKTFPKTPDLRRYAWMSRDPSFPFFCSETFSRCWNHYIKHVPCQ